MPPDANHRLANDAADTLRRIWRQQGITTTPHTAVILGSGLGAAGDAALESGAVSVPLSAIPGIPTPRVHGHRGRILTGGSQLNGSVLLQGRVHYYEGYSPDEITLAIRILYRLGVQRLVITNAAGGIRATFVPGDLMLINDHLAMVDLHSLRSVPEHETNGLIWDVELQQQAMSIATPLTVHSGVYAMMSGPNYETPAEVRMLRQFGADAVGMSTVPEALLARRLGLSVLGVSCITNVAAGLSDRPLSHEHVGQTAASVESEFAAWLQALLM